MKICNFKELSRIVFYLCATAVCMFTINSCQLKEEVIVQCKTACNSFGNRLLEVSSTTCECGPIDLQEDESLWIR